MIRRTLLLKYRHPCHQLRWLQPYSDCSPTATAALQWLQPYSDCSPTATAQRLQPYSDCSPTVTAALQWLQPYSDRTATAALQWLQPYSDCSPTATIALQRLPSDCSLSLWQSAAATGHSSSSWVSCTQLWQVCRLIAKYSSQNNMYRVFAVNCGKVMANNTAVYQVI